MILDILSVINKIHFFDKLDFGQKRELLEMSRLLTFAKGSVLYYENDVVNDLLFLADGLIKVYKVDKFDNEIFLYHINQFEMINETNTILTDEIYCYSNTEFKQESKVLAIDYKAFREQFLASNILTLDFLDELAKKNHKLQCILNRELVFDSSAKVAYMLSHDLLMFNEIKRTEVSFMLHIQPETLSRILSKFKRSELIDISDDGIKILNQKELEAMYKGVQI